MGASLKDNNIDDSVDIQISECLNPHNPKSFFLFAGAGSGKTKSLVQALMRFKDSFGYGFALKSQKIAIITYTNTAADEITQRLKFDPIFNVSTIHSFAWELIKSLTSDIKIYVEGQLKEDLEELNDAQTKSKDLNNKTSIQRAKKIVSKERRLKNLPEITQFTYNPNGDNIKKDSLNHTEVIGITAHFMENEPLMQDIIVARFPIILVDESQDTKKELIKALFSLQNNKKAVFSLGLFGDTMQRIYADGQPNLGLSLPKDWLLPSKQMNHRSDKRIIKLINDIRKGVDKQEQLPRVEKADGVVKLFISSRDKDKTSAEELVAEKMSVLSKDKNWLNADEVKILILEHHMAAKRMGFLDLFQPLYNADKLKTSLLDGSLSALNIFRKIILPLVDANNTNDKFAIARIVKLNSPLFDKKRIESTKNQLEYISTINNHVEKLLKLWEDEADPLLMNIVEVIKETNLFSLPGDLKISVSKESEDRDDTDEEEIDDNSQSSVEIIEAWEAALQTPFSQVFNYNEYLSEKSRFATHQGVKGLEFPRVMVIIDDEEAKGFMFSYDKLFGSKGFSATDIKNLQEGKETGIDRTRRLFYVACSRAEKSLAIVAYTNHPETVKANALAYGWFEESEIEII
ncbi:ATP-dependent DNA helicase Rep [Arenibacter antarcticus]|uniref:DNA 3'-5' helicase II n=1 Tax=Arenibacter antarcticus TaxID=2040469 RepID=A0ABW5VE88_9FLAO|nr:ATP-dependent helicase [Arenibacter sp. H213]MCM4166578.1 ATP-dependent helicase [Arenibacter sp. H213]